MTIWAMMKWLTAPESHVSSVLAGKLSSDNGRALSVCRLISFCTQNEDFWGRRPISYNRHVIESGFSVSKWQLIWWFFSMHHTLTHQNSSNDMIDRWDALQKCCDAWMLFRSSPERCQWSKRELIRRVGEGSGGGGTVSNMPLCPQSDRRDRSYFLTRSRNKCDKRQCCRSLSYPLLQQRRNGDKRNINCIEVACIPRQSIKYIIYTHQ